MYISLRIFLSLGLLLCISAQAADDKPIDDTATFNQIKVAVFAKKSNSNFENTFIEKYPKPTKSALLELMQHVDKYEQGPECWPPRSAVKIGSERIALRDKIAITIDKYFSTKQD